MKSKRFIAAVLGFALIALLAAGCGAKDEPSVYYLSFKPEADAQWQALAAAYTEKTGVPVNIITAASGQYETTLRAEISKREAPTLFQINGPVGLASWRDYCYDLSGSQLYGELVSDDFALYNGTEVAGIGYAIETYGLIYNKTLLQQAGYTEADIKSFSDLKAVAEDITARSAQLGFSAFTSAGMDGSSSWRYNTHLANLPIYYEYETDAESSIEAIKGTYLENFKNIWDLYINNSVTPPTGISNKTMNDVNAEFLSGQAVFLQNGSWAYSDIGEIGDENLGMLPIYIGAPGEEQQGLCTGTENYWCVNKEASEGDIKATLDFLYYCASDPDGISFMCNELGLVTPFKNNIEPTNPFVIIADRYVADGYKPVDWAFSTIPSQAWKDALASVLTQYSAGSAGWDAVQAAFVDDWASEYQLVNG